VHRILGRRDHSVKFTRLGLILVVMVLLLAACAAGANPQIGSGDAAGFWLGLWHGIISPVTFVISLFTDQVNLYEVNNSGNWYDFGFVVGAGILLGGGGAGARRGGR
jgi:hypothetical protein